MTDTLVKTLGVCWDTASDEISFDFTDLIDPANTMKATKRSGTFELLRSGTFGTFETVHYHDENWKVTLENSFWWNGPQFLRNLEDHWPKTTQVQTEDEQAWLS